MARMANQGLSEIIPTIDTAACTSFLRARRAVPDADAEVWRKQHR